VHRSAGHVYRVDSNNSHESSKPPFVFGVCAPSKPWGDWKRRCSATNNKGHSLLTQLLAVVRRRRAFTAPIVASIASVAGGGVGAAARSARRAGGLAQRCSSTTAGQSVSRGAAAHAGYHPHDAAVVAHISTPLRTAGPALCLLCLVGAGTARTTRQKPSLASCEHGSGNHQP